MGCQSAFFNKIVYADDTDQQIGKQREGIDILHSLKPS